MCHFYYRFEPTHGAFMHYTVLAYLPTHVDGKLTNIPVGPLCITENREQVIAVIQKAQTEVAKNRMRFLVFKSEVGKSYTPSNLTLDSPLFMCAVRYMISEWTVFYNNRAFRTHARKLAGLGTEIKGKLGKNSFFVD